MYAEVALTQGNFVYLLREKFGWISPGYAVLVPFKNSTRMGVVVKVMPSTTVEKLKSIKAVLYEEPILSEGLISLSFIMAEYYGVTQGSCIKLMLPPWVRERVKNGKPLVYESRVPDSCQASKKPYKPEEQKIHPKVQDVISSHHFRTFLLFGENRTSTYLSSIEYTLRKGREAIFLQPEIALTSSAVEMMRARFGDSTVVLHSKLRQKERAVLWEGIRKGDFKLCIGSMSAVFAPFPNLGLIIVDEEHSDAYKAGQRPWHNVRDVAVIRAKIDKIPCVLGSSTPSFESFYNAKEGKYELIHTGKAERTLPITLVDMRKEKTDTLSRYLVKRTRERLERGEKVILFLPRKGYSQFCMCLDCGWIPYCPRCSVTLNYYRRGHMLKCHYCGYERPAPTKCGDCGGVRFGYPGKGTERLEVIIKSIFKGAKVIRMDKDILKTPREYEEAYRDFKEEGDILFGTQLVIKTPQPNSVTLVGIISCDTILSFPDFRASERVFSQIMRTKKMVKDGEIVLQTYNPENRTFRHIKNDDYVSFYSEEIKKRQRFKLPPFSHLIRILSTSTKKEKARELINRVADELKKSGYEFLGASPCPIERIKGRWRYHIIVKVNDPRQFFHNMSLLRGVSVKVDPRDMM
jgi:primosomal protein N' (replication factor Y)